MKRLNKLNFFKKLLIVKIILISTIIVSIPLIKKIKAQESDQFIIGYIKTIYKEDTSFIIDTGNQTLTILTDNYTKFYFVDCNNNDCNLQKTNFSNLKIGEKVKVFASLFGGENVFYGYIVEIIEPSSQIIIGKVKSIDSKNNSFVVNSKTITTDKNTDFYSISCNNNVCDLQKSSFYNLKTNQNVSVFVKGTNSSNQLLAQLVEIGTTPPPPQNCKVWVKITPFKDYLDTKFKIEYGITSNCRHPAGYIDLSFLNVTKNWGYATGTRTLVDKAIFFPGNLSKTYIFNPEYHGWQNFEIYYYDLSGDGSLIQSDRKQFKFFVYPTDIKAKPPSANINKPLQKINDSLKNLVKSKIPPYVVGSFISVEFGVNLDPGVFKKDMGVMWLSVLKDNQEIFRSEEIPLENTIGDAKLAYTGFMPKTAGKYTLCTIHNADDEIDKSPDKEYSCTTINVYRYICYSGFCYECSEEPKKLGAFVDLKSGNCKIVEPVKCWNYICSYCKGGGKE